MPLDLVSDLPARAGLAVRTRVVREPEAPERLSQAYLLARKATA